MSLNAQHIFAWIPAKLRTELRVGVNPETRRLGVQLVVDAPSGESVVLAEAELSAACSRAIAKVITGELKMHETGARLELQVAAPARTVPLQQPPPNESEHTMSWSISAKGANKDEALQHFNTAVEANTYAPQEGRLQQAAAELAKYAANDAGTYEVASYGHLEPDGHGHATVKVESYRPTPQTDTPAA